MVGVLFLADLRKFARGDPAGKDSEDDQDTRDEVGVAKGDQVRRHPANADTARHK